MRILSVDDREENLYLLESLLKAHGHDVVSVMNGVQALARLEQERLQGHSFDTVITDILMPQMDGFQLCREMKSRAYLRHIPVIIYTATYTSREDEELARSIGAARFIIKPADPDQFMAALLSVIDENSYLQDPDLDAMPETLDSGEFLQVYNQRIVQKLERKVEQLEEAGKSLREAQAQLIRSQEQFQLVWDNSADGMLLLGENRRILKANAAFARICNLTAAELADSISGPALPWLLPLPSAVAQCRFERQLTLADGSQRVIEITSTPIISSLGFIHFCLLRDVTETRRNEVERAALEASLADARKMESLGRLAGGIAHDFNNLLTVIIGYSDIALRYPPANGAQEEALKQIRSAGGRAAELTGQLLAFSRGHHSTDQELNFNQVISETLPMVQRLIGDHISVVTKLEPALGNIRGQVSEFMQILTNLAANARDAMPNGGVLTITTANMAPAGLVSLSVRDTGSGIGSENLPHIFEPFFTTKAGEGTGLGLFTVAGIVQHWDGVIHVRTGDKLDAAGGTEFQILFPRFENARPKTPQPALTEPKTDNQQSLGGTILVVDDRNDVRKLVAAELELNGYSILEADSGEQALRIASEYAGKIDLLLTDLVMPNMDGRELASRFRAARPETRVLFMSGNPGDKSEGDAGPRCILKPFREQPLVSEVRKVLSSPPPSTESRGQSAG